MAEALVFAVLQKIAAIIGEEALKAGTSKFCKEASVLRELQYDMKQIQGEFEVMQGFLRKVDVQASGDQIFQCWLEQVRKVAYNVEDIIDEYAYLVGQKRCTKNIAKKTIYCVKNAKAWHEIATQLKEVKGNLDHLTRMRDRYGITIPEGNRSNRSNANGLLNMSGYSHLVDENEIVGNLEERNQLVQWLTNTDQNRTIVSILGMGGLGKTTLVSGIYKTKEIKEKYECCAFLSVSQKFQVEDLLRSTIKQILEREAKSTTEFDCMDHTSLEEKIRKELQNKRYLIVLDDVWGRDAWSSLSRAFPKNNEGSRVVITTRIEDVACLADENRLITMRALSKEEAWELFNKKAFVKLKEKTCPQELVGWAEKILDRCQGLPLAIVAIGSLLSFKGTNETQWRLFYNQLSWELSNNMELSSVANVLNLSYDNLPTYLKNCFLYCSLLPEDFLIRRKWIIRLFIAEGFIEDRGPEITMEEVAESYLVELAHRSLFQVVERNDHGRAKSFRMHDLVRDICIAKAKTESFGIGCGNHLSPLDGNARRIFIHNLSEDSQPIAESSKLRSLIFFETELSLSGIKSALANLRLLRVLSLSRSNIEHLPDVIFELFNLHYLDLSFTKVKVIPKSLGKLKLLETLDLRFTPVVKLPREITNLSKLRHLFAAFYIDYEAQQFDSFIGVSITSNICGLKELTKLNCIEANDELVLRLGSLVKLRSLFLLKVKASHIGDLQVSITKLPFLSNLGIIACNKDEVLNLQTLYPLPGLEKLYLKGKLEGGVIPPIFSSFSKLRDLRLGWLGLREDHLSSFSHMSNLVQLYLYRIYEGPVLTFRSGWFPKLQILFLADLIELIMIDFEDGTMGSLDLLYLIGLSKLRRVPEGMRYLRMLTKFMLTDMPEEFFQNLVGNDQNIIQHIPFIGTGDYYN